MKVISRRERRSVAIEDAAQVLGGDVCSMLLSALALSTDRNLQGTHRFPTRFRLAENKQGAEMAIRC